MRGDLRQSSLAEVVRDLYAERRSGILHVSRQSIRRRIHFKKGVAIFADAGDNQLQSREQAELLAYSLFTWTSGEFAFEDGEPNITESLAFEGSPSNVILEGIRRIDELEILERLMGGRDSVFACTQTSVLPLFKMRLSPAENAILTFARDRDQFTAAELPLPSEDLPVVNALNALVGVGLLEIVKKEAPREPAPVPVLDSVPVIEAETVAFPVPTPIPVAPAPPPVAAPTQPPVPPPPAPPPAPPVPAPAAPPVAAAPVAPTPPAPAKVAPLMPSVPSEMEQLFETLESKRSGNRPRPSAPEPARQQPIPVPVPHSAPPQETPVIEASVAPTEPPPEVQPAPAPAPAPTPTVEIVQPAPVAPVQRPPQPVQPAQSPQTPSAPRPSLMAVVSGWKDAAVALLPGGKAGLIAGGALALVAVIVVLLVLVLSSRDDAASQPDAVVAADSTPSTGSSSPDQPPPSPTPTYAPDPTPEPETVPSEAELFYRANLAFESGDFEQSREELTKLLELEPDLAAARQLMARVELELAPKPEPPKPKTAPRRVTPPPPAPPPPKTETETETVQPAGPTPNEVYADARAALNRGELELSQAKLEQLSSLDPSYPGAQQLEEDLANRLWQKTLPLAYSARHDHALGGCDGVLTLTARGLGYRSQAHDWFWSFSEVAVTERRDSRRLRIENTNGQSYNFELRDPLVSGDWDRYQKLRSR